MRQMFLNDPKGFLPNRSPSGLGIALIDEADSAAFGELPRSSAASVVVTDHHSEAQFRIGRASCGAGCFCAAQVFERL